MGSFGRNENCPAGVPGSFFGWIFLHFLKEDFMKNTFVGFFCLQVHLNARTLNGTKEEKII